MPVHTNTGVELVSAEGKVVVHVAFEGDINKSLEHLKRLYDIGRITHNPTEDLAGAMADVVTYSLEEMNYIDPFKVHAVYLNHKLA